MDPLTLAALAGTALSSIGKLAGGFQDSEVAQLQSQIADSNTKLLIERAGLEKRGAELTDAKGALEQTRLHEHLTRIFGGETGTFTAGNLDPTSGSPLLLQGYSAAQGAVDESLIAARMRAGEAEATSRAAGTMSQAAQSAYQSASARMRSNQSIIAGMFGAGSAVLQGVGRMRWSGLQGGGSYGGSPMQPEDI